MNTRATRITGRSCRRGPRAGDSITPTQRMMLAVLNDALATFERGLHADGSADAGAFDEVERWFASVGARGAFTYENVCARLGLDPGVLRDALRLRRLELLESLGREAAGATHRLPVQVPVASARA